MFEGEDVGRRFDDADGAVVAFGVGADEAAFSVADVTALLAALRGVQGVVNGIRQLLAFCGWSSKRRNAMRCAVLLPTPGRQVSACTSWSNEGEKLIRRAV